jgi:hypothetical protein
MRKVEVKARADLTRVKLRPGARAYKFNCSHCDCDPENCDEGDFYGDEAQMLWCSVDCYLRLLSALGIRQDFISVEKLEALATAHFAGQFPNLLKGIVTSTREALNP